MSAEPGDAVDPDPDDAAAAVDPGGVDAGYHYQDLECTICGRHNRDVHLVAAGDDLRICQVCVARCAEVIDADTGTAPPAVPWTERWALKSAGR